MFLAKKKNLPIKIEVQTRIIQQNRNSQQKATCSKPVAFIAASQWRLLEELFRYLWKSDIDGGGIQGIISSAILEYLES